MERRAVVTILVLNAGSSSVKAAAFGWAGAVPPAGRTARLEPTWSAEVRWTALPARTQLVQRVPPAAPATLALTSAGDAAAALLRAASGAEIRPQLIAHRIVHGGALEGPALLDDGVRRAIEEATALAPLHNQAALDGIEAARSEYPGVPNAVDLDTAFHRTLAPAAAAYAVPYAWYAEHGWRKYGFHGISHRDCAARTAALLGADPAALRMVSAHLGNGCSLAAIVGGRSVDTTMGFTPLDGLMMGTRSGSVDPGLVLFLMRSGRYDAAALEHALNAESGLLAISGVSDDIRDVLEGADAGDARCTLAVEMYVGRIASGIAAMTAACGGIDALAFTGGVGEHAASVRAAICARLSWMGIPAAERALPDGADGEIGSSDGTIRVAVITAREEAAIARATAALVPASARA